MSRVEPDRWTGIRVHTEKRDAIIEVLFALGAEGVEERADEIVTHVRSLDEAEATRRLRAADGDAGIEFAPTPAADWSSAWRARLSAHRVGRLVVTPPWLADQYGIDERIVIDPGMAFGTGDHETTRGVLTLMQDVLRPADVVADLGAGSAVLAIGATKLGAKRAVAIEMDPDAIENAEANVARNGVADRVTVIEGDAVVLLPLVAPVRVILANIISSAIQSLLPIMLASLTADGVAIVSGILVAEKEEIEAAVRRAGWRVTAAIADGQWWSATIAR